MPTAKLMYTTFLKPFKWNHTPFAQITSEPVSYLFPLYETSSRYMNVQGVKNQGLFHFEALTAQKGFHMLPWPLRFRGHFLGPGRIDFAAGTNLHIVADASRRTHRPRRCLVRIPILVVYGF